MRTAIKKILKIVLPERYIVYLHAKDCSYFFHKNRKRVNAVVSSLSDERSKDVYLGIIKGKCGLHNYENFYTPEAEYFQNNFFKYGENEFLIDCGAYTGDSIESFIKFVPNYKGIISFEPIPIFFKTIKDKYGNNPKIQLINKGVWNKIEKLSFLEDDDASRISTSSIKGKLEKFSVDVVPIDSLDLHEKITLIKMDIEGAELNALKGASQTILRDKPKLAICIYHSNEDMIQIAEYIHQLCPQYKLYVRHHGYSHTATILYGCL